MPWAPLYVCLTVWACVCVCASKCVFVCMFLISHTRLLGGFGSYSEWLYIWDRWMTWAMSLDLSSNFKVARMFEDNLFSICMLIDNAYWQWNTCPFTIQIEDISKPACPLSHPPAQLPYHQLLLLLIKSQNCRFEHKHLYILKSWKVVLIVILLIMHIVITLDLS